MRFCVAITITTALLFGSAYAEEEPEGARGAGFTYAKRVLAKSLHNPKSADFDWESVKVDKVFPVQSDGKDVKVISVSGVVRATNSFNAVVSSKWQVLMMLADGKYEPMVVVNGGQFVAKTEKGERFLNLLLEQQNKKGKQQPKSESDGKESMDAPDAASRKEALKAAYEDGRKAGETAALKDQELAEQFAEGFKAAIRAVREGDNK